MDLNQFSTSQETARMELCNPKTGEPFVDEEGKKCIFILYGKDSSVYQEEQRKIQNRKLTKTLSTGLRVKLSAEELEADALALLVACTKDWENILESGRVLECNEVNARVVYSKYPWVREQVSSFIEDRANFLGNSS